MLGKMFEVKLGFEMGDEGLRTTIEGSQPAVMAGLLSLVREVGEATGKNAEDILNELAETLEQTEEFKKMINDGIGLNDCEECTEDCPKAGRPGNHSEYNESQPKMPSIDEFLKTLGMIRREGNE